MNYIIMSGKYETGNEEEKQGYKMLFGEEDIQFYFDLYFHWYNLVHEMGHCIVEKYGVQMSKVEEEMYVNSLAVAYYRYMGEDERLKLLKERLANILNQIPSPVPEGDNLVSFYSRIWGTDQMNNVMVYGYFQFGSVLEALKAEAPLEDVLNKIGIKLNSTGNVKSCAADINAENSAAFITNARENMISLGVNVPEIRIELQQSPMIQCAREDK